jgi:phosphate transport system substrate-binding protein
MILRSRKMPLLATGAVVLALLATACGGDSKADAGTGTEGGVVTGEITISGSSTVEPISSAVAGKFSADNPDVNISVEGPGTGDGFALFCEGETDISDASRPIKLDEEEPICKKNGIDYIELKVGIDGLSVITSHDNEDVTCLGFPDLYALLGPESEGFKNWSDANSLGEEVGATHAPYPDVPLDITGPGEESGTYDSFGEIALEGIAYDEQGIPEDDPVIRPDYQASANDTVIIEGVAGSPSSLGWVGYAYYVQNEATVKALEIEDEDGNCVAPTPETIQSGEYPIARDLYFYVNAAKAESNPALSAFVDFYLSDAGISSVNEVGYVDLHPDDLQKSRDVWDARETGSHQKG